MSSARYSCQMLMILKFLNRFLTNIQVSYLIKILVIGTKLFHADGLMKGHLFIYLMGYAHGSTIFEYYIHFSKDVKLYMEGTAAITGTLSGTVLLGTQKVSCL